MASISSCSAASSLLEPGNKYDIHLKDTAHVGVSKLIVFIGSQTTVNNTYSFATHILTNIKLADFAISLLGTKF